MNGAVLIDVDRTLIDGESFRAFVLEQMVRTRHQGTAGVLGSYLLRRLGRISVESFKERCLANLAGLSRQELESIGSGFSASWLIPRIRSGAGSVLNACRIRREPVVLVSGSLDLYVKALSESLGVNGFVSTELEYDGAQKFSGRFAGGDCVGGRKAERVQQFALAQGIVLEESTAYADGGDDIDLLRLVGRPIAVWPDRRLKEECARNRWPIEYW